MSVRRVMKISGLALGFLLIFFVFSAAQAAVSITIDKNSQRMTVAVDGVTKYQWPVSSGLPAYETPNGAFKAFRMEADHYSKEWDDAPMPHSIFFTTRGHAIHGTDSVRNIGNPASHGCVRLSRENAATLFALVEQEGVLNTSVTLTGSSTVALARRKTNTIEVAAVPRDEARITTTDNYTVQAPRQLVPQAQGYDDNVVYGVDQWGRTVMIRRAPRAAQRGYAANPYEQQQGYYQQPSYGYRNPYYAPPRRGLFGGGVY